MLGMLRDDFDGDASTFWGFDQDYIINGTKWGDGQIFFNLERKLIMITLDHSLT